MLQYPVSIFFYWNTNDLRGPFLLIGEIQNFLNLIDLLLN